jgi:hypothetical protein
VTEIEEAVGEGSPAVFPLPGAQAESAQRANIVPQAEETALKLVTQRVQHPVMSHVADRARSARCKLASGVAALDTAGSLADAHPPTFRQARARHHECAGWFKTWPFVGWLRLAWGYAHLAVIKPALNLAEWITETPSRFFTALIIGAVIWYWS